jgi:hypothetical protein
MTNAHVAKGLIDFISNYDMTGIKLIAVRDGGRINVDNSFELDSFAIHQEYDSTKQYTYDFSLLTIKSGVLTDTCNFESTQQLYNLAIGDPIYTVGFPGEANDLNTIQPIATYKDGTISALRPFDPDRTPASSQTNVVIQHNFNTSGGTSGSPVFNNSGKVIGIHNSGEYEFIRNSDGTVTRVPVASIGYAIRIDQRTMVENCFMTSFSSIPPCQDAKLKLLNNSTTSIYYFYIKPSSSTTWSSDLLGTKTIISGGSMNFTGIPAGTYDLRVQNQGKTLGKTIYNQDLEDCHSYTWTITSLSSSY